MLWKKQYTVFFSQAPLIVKKHIDLCFSHSLNQLIMEPTRTTENTKTLIDQTFIEISRKCGVI